jgi:hypothetical protein
MPTASLLFTTVAHDDKCVVAVVVHVRDTFLYLMTRGAWKSKWRQPPLHAPGKVISP